MAHLMVGVRGDEVERRRGGEGKGLASSFEPLSPASLLPTRAKRKCAHIFCQASAMPMPTPEPLHASRFVALGLLPPLGEAQETHNGKKNSTLMTARLILVYVLLDTMYSSGTMRPSSTGRGRSQREDGGEEGEHERLKGAMKTKLWGRRAHREEETPRRKEEGEETERTYPAP